MANILPTEIEVRDALRRRHFATFVASCFDTVAPGRAFVTGWHILAIAYQLERIRTGEIRRLLITMPPRSLKSICASVAFPAFVLGHDPSKRIVCLSYANDLAAQHARDCKAVMQSGWYRALFPNTRISDARSMTTDFETTRRGARITTTVGGTLTGRGGSLIIIDDPQKPTDAMSDANRKTTLDWYRNTLLSRLDDKRNDAIVCVMQRLHVDDLAAHMLESGQWVHLDLPAIAQQDMAIDLGVQYAPDSGQGFRRKRWINGELLHPQFLTREVLDAQQSEMGSFNFQAQYLQRPVPAEGNLVKREWFKYYGEPPKRPSPETPGRIIQSWDFAVAEGASNDWSVCLTAIVRRNAIHILDVFRKKLDYPAQRRAFVELAQLHHARVCLVEKAANGSPLLADLRNVKAKGVPTPIAVIPRGSKIERMSVESHRIEAGDILLPEKAHWLDDFLAEICAFPGGRHDDQVDALSQLLQWLTRDQRRLKSIGLPIIVPPGHRL